MTPLNQKLFLKCPAQDMSTSLHMLSRRVPEHYYGTSSFFTTTRHGQVDHMSAARISSGEIAGEWGIRGEGGWKGLSLDHLVNPLISIEGPHIKTN